MEGFFDGDLLHYEQATAMWQAAIGKAGFNKLMVSKHGSDAEDTSGLFSEVPHHQSDQSTLERNQSTTSETKAQQAK